MAPILNLFCVEKGIGLCELAIGNYKTAKCFSQFCCWDFQATKMEKGDISPSYDMGSVEEEAIDENDSRELPFPLND